MVWLLRLVAAQDATVLDPFAGSGSTLVAAQSLWLKAVGIELDDYHCAIADRRLAENKAKLPL